MHMELAAYVLTTSSHSDFQHHNDGHTQGREARMLGTPTSYTGATSHSTVLNITTQTIIRKGKRER